MAIHYEAPKEWYDPETINTVQDFVLHFYRPALDSPFYKAHGYNLWLIRQFQKDFTQLCVLSTQAYAEFMLHQFAGGPLTIDSYIGKKIVRANRILTGFFTTTVGYGWPGVVFGYNDKNEPLVRFPYSSSALFGPKVAFLAEGDYRDEGEVFESQDQFQSLMPEWYVPEPSYLTGYWITLGDAANIFRIDGFGSIDPETVYYVIKAGTFLHHYTLVISPADKSKKGYKKGTKANSFKVSAHHDRAIDLMQVITIVQGEE